MSVPRPAVGVGLIVLGAVCFTVNAGVSRVALRAGVDPAMLTTLRVTGTVVVLAVIAALFARGALRVPRGRLLLLVIAQGFTVAALQWTYFVAIDRLPVGMALLLEYQAPILVALWALLVQRVPVGRSLWLGLALAVIGLAAATEVWQGARFDGLGVAAGLAAAVCFASYFLIGEAALESQGAALDPVRVSLWSFVVAAVALNLVVPISSFDRASAAAQVSLLGVLEPATVPLWTVLAWVVVMGTVVPFFAALLALAFIRATTVTVIAFLEPIGVSALGWAWFRESLGPVAILGCVAVVVGIVVAQFARGDRTHPVPTSPPPIT